MGSNNTYNKIALVIFFCLLNFINYGQTKEEALKELNANFKFNISAQSVLSNYKVIATSYDECYITVKTIDYADEYPEIVTVTFPTKGVKIKPNGEIHYKSKVIKKEIKNKATKEMAVEYFNNSKDVGILISTEDKTVLKKNMKRLNTFCKRT